MDRNPIYDLLEEASFSVPGRETDLSEIIGTPVHIEDLVPVDLVPVELW